MGIPFRMNYLIAASRGGGIKEMIPKKYLDHAEVKPGATIAKLAETAVSLLPPPRRNISSPHVYIMAGIPDLTIKVKSDDPCYCYTESIFIDEPITAIARVKNEIDLCGQSIRQAGGIPIFCTITNGNIAKYNHTFLTDGRTSTHHHNDMHSRLTESIDEINYYIDTTNQRAGMSTPMCHRAIQQRRGRRGSYYIYQWEGLHDGIHGTPGTRKTWAESIKA